MRKAGLLLIAALAAVHTCAFSQTADTLRSDRVTTNARMLGVGSVGILDTYLSPEKYSGFEVRYISHTTRRREGRKWSRMLVHQGSFALAENRAGNADEIAGMYTFSYGAHRNWTLCDGRLGLMAGAQADLDIGFLYNTRNGNNPAQARLALNVSPSAAVSYRFRLWNTPFEARYEAAVPMFGLMFSPNFGQSYYEIFSRGDYDRNVVPTTFIATPSLRQMLTLDFTLGRTTLRVGYLGDFRQAKVNNLKYHTYSNMLLIGFVRQFKLTRIVP